MRFRGRRRCIAYPRIVEGREKGFKIHTHMTARPRESDVPRQGRASGMPHRANHPERNSLPDLLLFFSRWEPRLESTFPRMDCILSGSVTAGERLRTVEAELNTL